MVKNGVKASSALWKALELRGYKRSSPCKTCKRGWEFMGEAMSQGIFCFLHRCGKGHGRRRYVDVFLEE